jgi:hypothetical protein
MSDQKKMRNLTALGRTSQSVIVVLTIAAWFCLANHCALGLSMAGALPVALDEAMTGCPMHSAPAKEKKPATNLPCCKDVRALAAKSVASLGAAALRLVGAQDYAVRIFPPIPPVTIGLEGLDTGPPGGFSFAESVLQESLLAHAPPLS